MRPLELILIRHGQSELNVGLSNDWDCGSTPVGAEQSRAVGKRLRELGIEKTFGGVVSPYRRARETAAEVTAETGLKFEMDERIREWGPPVVIDGNAFEEESEEELFARIKEFYSSRSGKLVVVSHGSPIAVLTQLALGIRPLRINTEIAATVENCCLRWVVCVNG